MICPVPVPQRRDWLALVAVHSDTWLIAVAFYNGARLNKEGRRAPRPCTTPILLLTGLCSEPIDDAQHSPGPSQSK